MTNEVFQTELADKTIIVIPAGDHVGFHMKQIQEETDRILESIQKGDVRNVVIDGKNASYFSSSVIGGVIRLWEAATENGGRLVLCNIADDAMDAIAAMRLDTKWPSFETRTEALANLTGDR